MARDTTFSFYKGVNLSLNSIDTFYFANRSAQTTYFASKLSFTVTNCSYQRADIGKVKIDKAYKYVYDCDYLSFKNTSYENKTFYAFITGVEYIDDNTTIVYYVIDNVQTWLLDCTLPACYIERQHSTTDNFGDNMLLDPIDCGEYVTKEIMDNLSSDFVVVFQATFNVGLWASDFTTKQAPELQLKNGIYDNASQWAVYANVSSNVASDNSALSEILNAIYNGLGGVTVDDFINIYMYPKAAIALGSGTGNVYTVVGAVSQTTDLNKIFRVVGAYQSNDRAGQTIQLSQTLKVHPTTLDSYTPKNAKTLQYPYAVLHITNNDGSAIDLKYEKFRKPSDNSIVDAQLRLTGCTTGEGKVRLTPEQYLGVAETALDYDTAIDSSAFPTVSMVGDPYLIYLAQNKNRIQNGYDQMLYSAAASIGGAAASDIQSVAMMYAGSQAGGGESSGISGKMAGQNTLGAGVSSAITTFGKVQSLNAQFSDMAIAPATASGLSGIGLAFQNGKKLFTVTCKTVDRYHAKMIDDFYTMFGYPVRSIQSPNLCARTKFTYIKTVGVIVKGSAPELVKQDLENKLNNGLRFWSSTGDIGDFSVNNAVITPTP